LALVPGLGFTFVTGILAIIASTKNGQNGLRMTTFTENRPLTEEIIGGVNVSNKLPIKCWQRARVR
jgi:hypothetical protein